MSLTNTPAPEDALLLTPAQVAEKLQVSQKTVLRLVRDGKLLAVRLDGMTRLRIRRADLERYVKRQKTTVEEAAEVCR